MIRSVTARVSGGSALRSIRDRRIRYDSASMGCTSVMSHLYRVGRTNFDALAALSAKLAENDQGFPVRPDRVLGAGQQARTAAAALTGDDDTHEPAHV